jgi:hypothetical protein
LLFGAHMALYEVEARPGGPDTWSVGLANGIPVATDGPADRVLSSYTEIV